MRSSGSWVFLLILALLIMYAGLTGRAGEMLASILAPRIVLSIDEEPEIPEGNGYGGGNRNEEFG
jgi:hypothetical protein